MFTVVFSMRTLFDYRNLGLEFLFGNFSINFLVRGSTEHLFVLHTVLFLCNLFRELSLSPLVLYYHDTRQVSEGPSLSPMIPRNASLSERSLKSDSCGFSRFSKTVVRWLPVLISVFPAYSPKSSSSAV